MLIRNWMACAAQVQAGPAIGLNQHSPDPYEGPCAGLTQVHALCHCSPLRPSQSDPVTTSVIAPPGRDQPGHLAWVTKVLLDTRTIIQQAHAHTLPGKGHQCVHTHTHTHTHTHLWSLQFPKCTALPQAPDLLHTQAAPKAAVNSCPAGCIQPLLTYSVLQLPEGASHGWQPQFLSSPPSRRPGFMN